MSWHEYLRRNALQHCSVKQKQDSKPPYQTVRHYCRYLLHTSILNRIPRRCPRKLPTNLSLWTATSWGGRICTAVTQTKSRDWHRNRTFSTSRSALRGLSDFLPKEFFSDAWKRLQIFESNFLCFPQQAWELLISSIYNLNLLRSCISPELISGSLQYLF